MIDMHHLSKSYGDKVAVNDLTVTGRPGVVTGFLGPNGAGKSTTMRMILGLDHPSSGEVLVNGRRYVDHDAPADSDRVDQHTARRSIYPPATWPVARPSLPSQSPSPSAVG